MLLTQLATVGPTAAALPSELPVAARGDLCVSLKRVSVMAGVGGVATWHEGGCSTAILEVIHLNTLLG